MAKRLSSYVHVADDEGQVHAFGPASEVPAWAAAKITNPAAWQDDTAEAGTGSEGTPAEDPESATARKRRTS